MHLPRKLAASGVILLALAGCQSATTGQQQVALPFASVGLARGLIGNAIGRDLSEADRRIAHNAEYQALEFGRAGAPISWKSPSGRYGEVIPQTTYSVNDTQCREYTQAVYREGRPEVARGTACRQSDGSWRPVA